MKRFKHSGTFGDLIYSLPLVKQLGGGEFYLHLDQINWIGQHYYGSAPTPAHQGRMTLRDFEYMRDFMLAQDYITDFAVLGADTEITHNLDRFRVPFVGHPGNYVDIYCWTFGIQDLAQVEQIRNSTWLRVPFVRELSQGRSIVINRTRRWLPTDKSPKWAQWQAEGLEQQSVFVGLPEEYVQFQKSTGWQDVPYQPCNTLLELAQYIAGAQQFIGNQSLALSLALGLGVPAWCEARTDLPLERNECYFPDLARVSYF
jgi:hypothetical protein